jgi:hypothetical protein
VRKSLKAPMAADPMPMAADAVGKSQRYYPDAAKVIQVIGFDTMH